MKRKELFVRICFSVIGVIVAGLGVSFLKLAALGVDPFQAFAAGLNALIPIPFGTLYLFIGGALLIFSLVLDRHYIGLATVVTFTIQGYVIDFGKVLLFAAFPAPGLPLRIVSFCIGILLLCFATAVYFTADLGVSAYDAVALIVTHTLKKGTFRFNRIFFDCICVLVGSGAFLLSGGKLAALPEMVGIGTIVIAFCMGPLVDIMQTRMVRPSYEKMIH